jgi:hypothetical protein
MLEVRRPVAWDETYWYGGGGCNGYSAATEDTSRGEGGQFPSVTRISASVHDTRATTMPSSIVIVHGRAFSTVHYIPHYTTRHDTTSVR